MAEKSERIKTYMFGGVVVVLLAVIAVMLIRHEAEQTRQAMNKLGEETSAGMKDAAKEGAQQTVREGAQQAKKTVKELPKLVLGEIADIVRDGKGDSGKDGDSNGRTPPQDVVSNIFKLGRDVLKTADDVAQEKFGLNVEEEKEIGEKVHQLIIRERQVADLPESQQRIERLAKPILETLERPRISYTFTIIDDDSINAFALPGGYIYVHTGLLDFVKTDPELQFVLGHEIGHVDLKHCIRNFTFAVRAAQASGGLAELPVQVVYNQYSLQFSEDSEFEADAYGFVRLVKFGRTRREALRFPSRLIEFHKSEGVATSQEKAKSVPDAMRQGFMNHFRTHPPSEDRLKKLEAIKIPGTDQ